MPEPSLIFTITTYEFYDNKWNPTLSHIFYGDSEKEIQQLIEAHKQTDAFFKASFEGTFNWKGGTITLRNVDSGYESIT